MPIDSQTHSSLIQGISQQSEIARGTASCEDQENCLNEVLLGAVSRMGSIIRASFADTYDEPYVHEVVRSADEQYIFIIENGKLRIFNRVTGQEASVSGDIGYYLSQSGPARKAFQAVSVGDTTFLLNRQKVVQMADTRTPGRPNQGIAYIKAGGYLLTFTLNITVNGKVYTTSFKTPDNSKPENAQYITTDYLAEQFRASLEKTVFPSISNDGNGPFQVQRYGSTLVITGGTLAFDLETSDGVGDTYFISFKDSVKTIANLPNKCVAGYQVSVAPDGSADSERYYLQYSGGVNTGKWIEVAAPATITDINASTMPHVIELQGVNQFTVKVARWGKRLAGDGISTSKDPSFVGYAINSLQFLAGRLAAASEFNAVLSRNRNGYVFFPDTAQTNLDSAPIDYDVSNGSSTLIEHAVVAGGKLQFWGNLQQTYLDTGQEAVKEKTTEVLPLANYEYDGEYPPKPIGQSSLLFGTTVGRWGILTEVFFRNGTPQGEIVVSAHVPKLLDGKFRTVASGQASGKTLCLTTNKTNTAYLYQAYNQGSDRVQSAWNKWTFKAPRKILWTAIMGSQAYFLFQWDGVVTLEVVQLDAEGDEPNEKFPLRLDHRVSEASATYGDGVFTLTLPYTVDVAKRGGFSCFERKDVSEFSQRGRVLDFKWINSRTVQVVSNSPDRMFYFGAIPVARRKDTRLFARDNSDQPIIHDRLLISKVSVSHKDTVEYDVVYHRRNGTSVTQTYTGRTLGDETIKNEDVPLRTDSFMVSIKAIAEDAIVELVNKTPFPAIWTAMKYTYDLTVRTG